MNNTAIAEACVSVTTEITPAATPSAPKPGPVSFEALQAAVAEFRKNNNWQSIVELLHPLEKRIPHLAHTPDAHKLNAEIAFACSQLKRYEDAIALYRECLKANPESYHYLAGIGFNYYCALMADQNREIKLGDRRKDFTEQAAAAFEQAEKTYPENVVDYYRHGMLYHKLSTCSDAKAVPLFEKAIGNWEALPPVKQNERHKDRKNYIKALYHLAKCCIALHMADRAVEIITRCIQMDEATNYEQPLHKFYIAGLARSEAGNHEEAVKFLRVAARQKTNRPKDFVYIALARCLMHGSDYEGAREWIEKIPERFRKPHMQRLYAVVLSKLAQTEKAAELFKEALKRDRQGRHKTLAAWGRMLQEQSKHTEAIDCFRRANEERRKVFAGDYDSAYYYAGLSMVATGDLKMARGCFRKTLVINQYHRKARDELRKLEDRTHEQCPGDTL